MVGAGLAGLVAAAEVADAGRSVLLLDQEGEQSPRRPGVLVASAGCSSSTAPSSAGWASRTPTSWRCRTGWAAPSSTATEDHWPRQWAEAYVDFAAGEKRAWLHEHGAPAVPGGRLGRARRRPGRRARQLGAALPPHLGHRPGRGRAVRAPGARGASAAGRVRFAFRHRVDELVVERRRGDRRARARCSSPTPSSAAGHSSRERGRRLRAHAPRP